MGYCTEYTLNINGAANHDEVVEESEVLDEATQEC